jgi:radical SAM protein with 4Fe4S-binding SPASM domain
MESNLASFESDAARLGDAAVTMPSIAKPTFDHNPVIVIWEATRACALACRHCRANAVTARDPNELNDGEARALLKHVRDEFGQCVLVITGGDPLERPGILEVARYGADLGLRMAITPAATPRLDRDSLARMLDAGITTVALSVDGADAETHDGFRRVNGTWRLTIDAFGWARDIGLSTQMNTSFGRHNMQQVHKLAQLGSMCGIALWSAFILVPTGRATASMLLDAAEHERLYRELAGIACDPAFPFAVKTTAGQPFYRVLAQKRDSAPKRRGRGVNDGNGFVFVAHDGTIAPSGFLPMACGNVRTHRLADVYRHDPTFLRLRRPQTFSGKCGHCEFNTVCGGSRSRTWALTGDPFGSDPTCLYQPLSGRNRT